MGPAGRAIMIIFRHAAWAAESADDQSGLRRTADQCSDILTDVLVDSSAMRMQLTARHARPGRPALSAPTGESGPVKH